MEQISVHKVDLLKYQIISNMNIICMAYFINKLKNEGIDLFKFKPILEPIKSLRHANCLVPGDRSETIKEIVDFRCSFELNIDQLTNKNVNDFLIDEAKKELDKLAKNFADVVKKYEHIDIVFPELPDATPMMSSFLRDEESDFASRLIYGTSLTGNISMFVFEFYAVFCERYREIESHEPLEP